LKQEYFPPYALYDRYRGGEDEEPRGFQITWPPRGSRSTAPARKALAKINHDKKKRQKKYLAAGGKSAQQLLAEVAEDNTCRYMHGDPNEEGMAFCGAGLQKGSSYCPEHHALCYRAPEEEGGYDG